MRKLGSYMLLSSLRHRLSHASGYSLNHTVILAVIIYVNSTSDSSQFQDSFPSCWIQQCQLCLCLIIHMFKMISIVQISKIKPKYSTSSQWGVLPRHVLETYLP